MKRKSARGFTLIELLVVVFILGILIAIALPVLEKAKEGSALTVCGTNLHGISVALHAYASEFNDQIPCGPGTPSSVDPSRPWNTVGDAVAWIGATKQYDGLGVLTTGSWLTSAKSL